MGLLLDQGYRLEPPTPFRPGVLRMRVEAFSDVSYCCCGSGQIRAGTCLVSCESDHAVDLASGSVDLRMQIYRDDPNAERFPVVTFSTGRRLDLRGEATSWAITDAGWGTRRRPPFDDQRQ